LRNDGVFNTATICRLLQAITNFRLYLKIASLFLILNQKKDDLGIP